MGLVQTAGTQVPKLVQQVPQIVQLPEWVEYVKALGTPTVALFASLVAALIAYRQWRTARDKLKLDFYDRRMQIYNCAMQLINMVHYPFPLDAEGISELAGELSGAHWLLSREVAAHLNDLAQRCYDNASREQPNFRGLSDDERLFAAKLIISDEKHKMVEEREALDKLFAPYLAVSH